METPRSALCVAVALPKEVRVFCMGYFKMPDWIIDDCMNGISPSDFCLLAFYCRVSNSRGESWYAHETISERTGMSLRQISRSMHALRDNNFIVVYPKGNRTRLIVLSEYIVKAIKTKKKTDMPNWHL